MADPQIAQWFYTVDKNKTGKLSAVELQQALRNNNYTTFDIQVVQVIFFFNFFSIFFSIISSGFPDDDQNV